VTSQKLSVSKLMYVSGCASLSYTGWHKSQSIYVETCNLVMVVYWVCRSSCSSCPAYS